MFIVHPTAIESSMMALYISKIIGLIMMNQALAVHIVNSTNIYERIKYSNTTCKNGLY